MFIPIVSDHRARNLPYHLCLQRRHPLHETHPVDEAKKLTTLVPDFFREAAYSILAYKPRCRALHGLPAVKMFSFTVAFAATFLASSAAAHGGVSSYIIGGELDNPYERSD